MNLTSRLNGRRVLVTGAGAGIGHATTLRLLAEGACVVATDVYTEGMDNLPRSAGLMRFPMDVTDETSVASGMTTAVDFLGGLDVVVNAAGILLSEHTHETPVELWNLVVGVNLTGTFLVTREALPALLVADRSVVVNFSSTAAEFGHPYMAAYAASKGGVRAFTHALALEYSKQGLRAVSIAPGSVKSGISDAVASGLPTDVDVTLFEKLRPILPTDLANDVGAPMGRPEAVAGVVAMLVSEDGEFITGTEIRVDGGTHA